MYVCVCPCSDKDVYTVNETDGEIANNVWSRAS